MLCVTVLVGCQGPRPLERTETEAIAFGPTSVRLHPVFTRTADFDDDGQIDGIEAVVELLDHFSDTTKGGGEFILELYAYEPTGNDRGRQLSEPWHISVADADAQVEYWSRTTRSYRLPLSYDGKLVPGERYVLSVIYRSPRGEALTNELVFRARGA